MLFPVPGVPFPCRAAQGIPVHATNPKTGITSSRKPPLSGHPRSWQSVPTLRQGLPCWTDGCLRAPAGARHRAAAGVAVARVGICVPVDLRTTVAWREHECQLRPVHCVSLDKLLSLSGPQGLGDKPGCQPPPVELPSGLCEPCGGRAGTSARLACGPLSPRLPEGRGPASLGFAAGA